MSLPLNLHVMSLLVVDALTEWVSADNLAVTPDVLITWRSDFCLMGVQVGVTRLAARWARKMILKGQAERCLWREPVTDRRQRGQRAMAE